MLRCFLRRLLVFGAEFCFAKADDDFVERARKLERHLVIFAHGCAGVGLPDLIVVILADNRPVAARVQKFQISKEEEPDRRMR